MQPVKQSGKNWSKEEVLSLFQTSFSDLLFLAHQTHRKNFDANRIQVSALLSIKTGSCPEDCSYCPQSAHFNTQLEKENLLKVEEVIKEATSAKANGVQRFCMGAAWRKPNKQDFELVKTMVKEVKELGLETCMTLGMLTEEQAIELKSAGLDYYNHNLDTSPEYYKEIITTRTYNDRLETIQNVRNAGLKVCCGGIIGMGESRSDRAGLLLELANLPHPPESVPINQLVKAAGTPLENAEGIDTIEFVKTIAVTRIMMPKSYIRLSAGREEMSDEMHALCYFAGANSLFYGDKLLTVSNAHEHRDFNLLKRLGIKSSIKEKQAPSPSKDDPSPIYGRACSSGSKLSREM